MVLLAAVLRIVAYPRIVSVSYGYTFDLSGFKYLIGSTIGMVGMILLDEALGTLEAGALVPDGGCVLCCRT